MTRHPLANGLDGNPIEVPETAVAWRLRRASGKPGRPQNVYDCDGRQLEVALGASVDDLRALGCGPGRYRLEAVDGHGKLIPGVVAFTEITEDGESEEPASGGFDHYDRMLQTIERQTDTLCRALEAMANAFGPVRPAEAPILIEGDGPREEKMRPEQMVAQVAGIAQTLVSALKGGGGAAGAAGGQP